MIKYIYFTLIKSVSNLLFDTDNNLTLWIIAAYYEQLFECNKNNIRSTWKILKTLTNKTMSPQIIKSLMWNNLECTSDISIANIFNDFFSNIATDLDDNLPTNNIDPTSFLTYNLNSLYFAFTSPHECSEIIRDLKCTRQDKNKIPDNIFKNNHQFFSVTISKIINECIAQEIVPISLKFGIITPIFNQGDPQNPSNYRPVSVLPILGNIFERIVYTRLINFFNVNSIISPIQFGFRKGRSTLDAIVNLT